MYIPMYIPIYIPCIQRVFKVWYSIFDMYLKCIPVALYGIYLNIVGIPGKYSVIKVYLGRYSINIYLNIPYNILWNIYIPLDLLEYCVNTA
jgi:hypothetical protein